MALKTVRKVWVAIAGTAPRRTFDQSHLKRWTWKSLVLMIYIGGEPSRFCGFSPPNWRKISSYITLFESSMDWRHPVTIWSRMPPICSNSSHFIRLDILWKTLNTSRMPGVVGWSKDPSFSKVSLLSNSSSDETLKQSHEKRNLNTFDALYMVHNWKWQIKCKSVLGPWTKQIAGFQTTTIKDCVQIGSNIFGRDMRGTGWLSTTLPTW